MTDTLYLECYSGISGDMAVAALLDLGADQEVLKAALESLPLEGFEIEISRVKKSGLDVCDFRVKLDPEHENHDHDMEYLHGSVCREETSVRQHHSQSSDHHSLSDARAAQQRFSRTETVHHSLSDARAAGQSLSQTRAIQQPVKPHDFTGTLHHHLADARKNAHEQLYGHGPEEKAAHHEHHEHRGLSEVLDILKDSKLSARAKETAGKIFRILAEAEAKAHGVPIEKVHFHEVGAVDSIVDIAALAVCMDNLKITKVIVPEIYEGGGFVRCQHGMIPVPVPAVVNIAEAYGIALHFTHTEGELVTPTGAAFVAAVRTSDRLPERFIIKKTGMGAGKRKYERPSLLRAMLLEECPAEEPEENGKKDTVFRLETNIDDCSGETLGYVMELLFRAGARDVYYTPVFMKKNRPAYQLNVLCAGEQVPEMEKLLFRETTTIGIRKLEMERTVLERAEVSVQTSLGTADVKVCILPDGEKRYYPEYESVKKLAAQHEISYQEAYIRVRTEAADSAFLP